MDFAAGSLVPAGASGNPDPDGAHLGCERCGGWNAEKARFCQHCGARLGPEGIDDARGWGVQASLDAPIVTALVCEVSTGGSAGRAWQPAPMAPDSPTALAQSRSILERHGGTVRDLPGSANALSAVFGPEPADGDGPLRALRAAAEIRTALAAGEEEGVSVRAGVGTSEVMGDDPDAERLWRDRVVDLAVRLQRMAEPGEVIVSETVYRRVGNAAELQPVDSRVPADGEASLGPLRLLDVTPGPINLGLAEAPLVGRGREMTLLREAFDRTVAAQGCSLVRLTGDTGLGKTRLGEELLRALQEEDAAVAIRVQCRQPDEGGILWPLAELVARAVGLTDGDGSEEARSKIERRLPGDADAGRVAERLLPAVGHPGRAVARETPWALRRLLEAGARERPLVVFIDDADRAGPGFDRLIRDVAERSRDAPILLLVARGVDPDPGDGPVVRLEPLGEDEVGSLVAATLGDRALAHDLREAVARACRGNPLVAEQLVAMLVGEGHIRLELGRWVPAADPSTFPVPESIEALLAERLRGLGIDERAVIGLAAVVGESFPWAPIAELVPEGSREAVRDHFGTLVGARLLRPQGEDGFAFVHPLVRAAAAAEVPAEVRAQVHERYGRWLESSGEAPHSRSAELVGSHFGSACRPGGDRAGHDELARRGARLLAAAATDARGLGDVHGALALWERASALLPPEDPELPQLLVEAGRARATLGDPSAADSLLALAGRIARTTGNPVLEWRAKLLRTTLRTGSADVDALEHIREVADATIEACLELGDDLGLTWAWSNRGVVYRRRGYWAAAADAAERAAEHARRTGSREEEVAALRDLAGAIVDGKAPVSESIERCERLLERVRGERPEEQEVAAILAQLLARRGSVEEARELVAVAAEELDGLGMDREEAACMLAAGRIASIAGQPDEAEKALLRVADMAERVGDRVILSQVAASLAHVFLDRGRAEEALELTEATEPPTWDDVSIQVEWRGARARALAATGGHDRANALARQAVKLADQTDLVELRAGALLDLADVLRLAGRANEAAPVARRALRVLERKGVEGAAERARLVLEQVEGRAPALEPSPSSASVDAPADTVAPEERARAEGSMEEPSEPADAPAEASGSTFQEDATQAPTPIEEPSRKDTGASKKSRWGW